MIARYRSGDVAGALTAYAEARTLIHGLLGIEPGPYLTTLHRAILDHRVEQHLVPAWSTTLLG